jgi:hypothetical protein
VRQELRENGSLCPICDWGLIEDSLGVCVDCYEEGKPF